MLPSTLHICTFDPTLRPRTPTKLSVKRGVWPSRANPLQSRLTVRRTPVRLSHIRYPAGSSGLSKASESRYVSIVMPAEGPSFWTAPSGQCRWNFFYQRNGCPGTVWAPLPEMLTCRIRQIRIFWCDQDSCHCTDFVTENFSSRAPRLGPQANAI